MGNDACYLTGEALGPPFYQGIHSQRVPGLLQAGSGIGLRIRELVANLGNSWLALLQISSGMSFIGAAFHAEAYNLCSKYKYLYEDAGTVIMSAHYDSRGSFGGVRHPGGEDDGVYP